MLPRDFPRPAVMRLAVTSGSCYASAPHPAAAAQGARYSRRQERLRGLLGAREDLQTTVDLPCRAFDESMTTEAVLPRGGRVHASENALRP